MRVEAEGVETKIHHPQEVSVKSSSDMLLNGAISLQNTKISKKMIHPMIYSLFPDTNINLPIPLGGRLKHFIKNWEKLTGDRSVLNVIRGWEIPFSQTPSQKKSQVPKQKGSQTGLIASEIQGMLEKGAIHQVSPCQNQILSHIFLREKKEGTYRPIINLKQVNQFIPYQKFKMETLKNIKSLLIKDDYMVKIDLKDAYFTVPLSPKSRRFVRFSYLGNVYEFLCLMFGLGPAPRIFTKIMKVPISILRRLKIRLIIYMDDMLLMAQTMTEILSARDTTLFLLEALGFVINYEKSNLIPAREMEFLGMMVNSTLMALFIPQKKMSELLALCRKTLKLQKLSLRKIAKLLMKLKATDSAFSWAPLQTRHLQQILVKGMRQGLSYEDELPLTSEAFLELEWWLYNMESLNGKPISVSPPDIIISTDAAKGLKGGWGAECQDSRTGGPWSQQESPYT